MAKKLKSGFEILRLSDLSFHEMTVEINFKGDEIAQINMDKGMDMLEIEIYQDIVVKRKNPKFLLKDFVEAINEATLILSNCLDDGK